MKTIKIKINENTGKIDIEASGYKNNKCLKVLKEIEEIVGKVEDLKLKPEGRINEIEKENIKA